MPPRTSKYTPEELEERKKREVLALRQLRHQYAAKVAQQARIMELAAKNLIKLHADMDKEAKIIAGDNYKEDHDLAFVEVERMADIDEDIRDPIPGVKDIYELAKDTARWAGECAAQDEPPPLPSE